MNRPNIQESEERVSDDDHSTLIPEHIVDAASQRIFLVSIFVVIQCWKIYDVLLVKADLFALSTAARLESAPDLTFTSLNNFTFVIKYVLIDGLFLWSLPMLNVPLLSFGPFVTLLLTVLVNIFTFLLASNTALPLLSGIVVPVWNTIFKHKELNIVGDSVLPQKVIDMNAHFKGKYTIHYLPASSVTLNPFHYEGLCLDVQPESSYCRYVRVPIEFNTTTDIATMQLQHISPSNSMTLLNYTSRDIAKLLKRDYAHLHKLLDHKNDGRIFYVEVELRNPGKYRIHTVTDSNGMNIRPYKSDFTVGNCPSAKFVYPEAELAYTNIKCVLKDNTFQPEWLLPLLSTYGVFPLSVEVMTKFNGKMINKFNTTLQSENISPGLKWLEAEKMTRNSLEQEILRNPLVLRTGNSGKFEFQLLSVQDKLGIRREYNPASKDHDINFPIVTKESASLKLVDRSPDSPLLLGQTKTLHLDTKQIIQLPLKVAIQFQDERNASEKKILTFDFNDAEDFHQGIKIDQPGLYSLVEGKDSFCPCEVDKGLIVPIMTPRVPTVVIKGEPISDRCVGTVGFEFDLKFTGKPPFEVLYEVFKNLSGFLKPILSERGLRQHTKRTQSDQYRFDYRPRQEGNYVLIFKSLKDVYYHNNPVAIPEAENTFSTYFHQKSRYTFFKDSRQTHQEINLCKGGAILAPIHFEGNFPFLFTYEIVDINTKKVLVSQKIKDYYQDSFKVSSPNFDRGGNYEIVVKGATDNLGCPVASLKSESFVINARSDLPAVLFKKSETFKIIEGDSVEIPLVVKSSVGRTSSDLIKYTHTDGDGNEKEVLLSGSNILRVSKEGTYRLSSFSNKGCDGTVKKDEAIQVEYYPKPSMTFHPEAGDVDKPTTSSFISLKPVCQDAPRDLKLKLTGKPPFVVAYLINYPHGKTKSSSMVIESNEISIPLTLKRKGVYEHMFTAVYDSRYTQDNLKRINHKDSFPTIRYEVQGSPNLHVDKTHMQFCENQISEDRFSASLPITFEGRYPFELSGSIQNSNGDILDKFEVHNVNTPSVDLSELKLSKPLLSLLSVGEYIIAFQGITDANKCHLKQLFSQNTVRISITQVPTILKQNPKDYYCVGEHIAYNMSGIAPFTLFYEFNGQMRKAEQGHDFVRLASRPGELTIHALKDSSASLCLVNYTANDNVFEKLKLEVRDLPSVEISQGDSIIKNLHEGDKTEIIFKFTGVPPFLVTYVRTLGDEEGLHKRRKSTKPQAKHPRRVAETKTVKDIWDYEHTEIVGLEGTYEAIMVADAFCKASRDINEIL